jgi:hypothetical protein
MSSRLTWFGRLCQKSFSRLDPKLTNSRCEDRIPIQKLVHVSSVINCSISMTWRSLATSASRTPPRCPMTEVEIEFSCLGASGFQTDQCISTRTRRPLEMEYDETRPVPRLINGLFRNFDALGLKQVIYKMF